MLRLAKKGVDCFTRLVSKSLTRSWKDVNRKLDLAKRRAACAGRPFSRRPGFGQWLFLFHVSRREKMPRLS